MANVAEPRLRLVANRTAPQSGEIDRDELVSLVQGLPVGSDEEEALLMVELMHARACLMRPASRFRATLVRCGGLLRRAPGHRPPQLLP